jgi:hypothetical protein
MWQKEQMADHHRAIPDSAALRALPAAPGQPGKGQGSCAERLHPGHQPTPFQLPLWRSMLPLREIPSLRKCV